jgi:hypothetical protein
VIESQAEHATFRVADITLEGSAADATTGS